VKQPKHKATAAQAAAAHKFAAAGRAAQARTRAAAIAKTGKPPPVSKKRHQVALKWAAAGRAAQARKRAHLKPLPVKKPAWTLHGEPVCAPVAIAEHLAAITGIIAPGDSLVRLAARVPGGCLGDFLAEVAASGLAGVSLAWYTPCDPDALTPGLVCGLDMPGGYHAVLSHPAGMVSWGSVMGWQGAVDQAWWLEWEHPA
jgi:hypothetical protein